MLRMIIGLLSVYIILMSYPAESATVILENGYIAGVNNLVVGEKNYNVDFIRGSYNEIYGSDLPMFFYNPSMAAEAATAIANSFEENGLEYTSLYIDDGETLSSFNIPYTYHPQLPHLVMAMWLQAIPGSGIPWYWGGDDLNISKPHITNYSVFSNVPPPTIIDITFDTCISEAGTTISLIVEDPAEGELSYTWEALDGGDIIGEGAEVDFIPPANGAFPSCISYMVNIIVTSSETGLSSEEIIEIKNELIGDVNSDGVVNIIDKVEVRNYFGQNGTPGWINADVNSDGVVNIMDKVIVRNQFGCSCP